MAFQTPVKDMQFLLEHAADFQKVRDTGAFEDLSPEFVEAILTEAAKLVDNVIAPLNQKSDWEGAEWEDGKVKTTPGFKEAYDQYVEGGWGGISFPEEYGGQDLSQTMGLLVLDALCAGCLSLAMGMSLTTGAVKAILTYGDERQKKLFLPKMVSGEWTGTMNLSEPQAGSDLAMVKCKAEPAGDGQYKIKGGKIWISYGDHDLTENICHLVLARLPDAPEGTRGISMFLVPKYRVNDDGSVGEWNDVTTVSIEEKLGQHGSPTCVLSYGDNDDCYGTLVGGENEGLKNMFVMMNAARIDVGLQAVAACEASYQHALDYAKERPQGRSFGVKTGDPVAIIEHPDVRRQLMTMRALTDAGRAICYANIVALDTAKRSTDEATRTAMKEREELLTPLAKGFGSERAMEITNHGIQIFGGVGFVEETGAAQFYRDSRICAIYEGTNGIQAIDLVGRKLGMKEGKLAYDFLDEMDAYAEKLLGHADTRMTEIGRSLARSAVGLRETTDFIRSKMGDAHDDALAVATLYLDQFGYVAGGYYLAKAAEKAAEFAAAGDDERFHNSKVDTAHYYALYMLPRANGLTMSILEGHSGLPVADAIPEAV